MHVLIVQPTSQPVAQPVRVRQRGGEHGNETGDIAVRSRGETDAGATRASRFVYTVSVTNVHGFGGRLNFAHGFYDQYS